MNRLFLSLLALGLAGCAPRVAEAPVSAVSALSASASFYPHEVGLTWVYHAEGDAPSSQPYVLQALGPTIFQGQSVQHVQLTGRGAQQTWYRTYENGVQLLGFAKPGATFILTPPLKESPAPNEWKIGLSWEGSSQLTVTDNSGKTQMSGTVHYRYDVQDFREVKVASGTYNVWVVTRQMTDTLGGIFPATQQYWFAPYIGDIRTPENILLTGKNFGMTGNPR